MGWKEVILEQAVDGTERDVLNYTKSDVTSGGRVQLRELLGYGIE
jgi:hypothetical protein